MSQTIYQVDSFTARPFAGNPAEGADTADASALYGGAPRSHTVVLLPFQKSRDL